MVEIRPAKTNDTKIPAANSKEKSRLKALWESDNASIVGFGTEITASLLNMLPHGVWGLYSGVLAFGLGATAATVVRNIIKPDITDKNHQDYVVPARRASQFFCAGLALSTGLAVFPSITQDAVQAKVLDSDSPTVWLAKKDAQWLRMKGYDDLSSPESRQADAIAKAAKRVQFTRQIVSFEGQSGESFYRTAALSQGFDAKSVADVIPGQSYCAVFGVSDSGITRDGVVKIVVGNANQRPNTLYAPYNSKFGHWTQENPSRSSPDSCRNLLVKLQR